ncbi:DASH family cryptochrome [Algibacter mikhailovii]|uniref:DASH family cryptochrome n=1 Tax=Algibacter mikhailovii TaxID=425498 RepID=UPI002494EF29|nr:DASH family cryptochrome [Algibacter mikhailovii]
MQKKQDKTGLVWFRNNLRVHDNTVLDSAIAENKTVIAAFFFDPRHFQNTHYGFKKTEKYRAQFLIQTIHELRTNLKNLNIELFVFKAKPELIINQLIFDHNITKVYLQKEWTSEENHVLNLVNNNLPSNLEFDEYFDQFLYHPDDLKLAFSELPLLFTDFRKVVERTAVVRPSTTTKSVYSNSTAENTTKIPNLKDLGFENFKTATDTAFPFKGGENSAINRLNNYLFETKKIGNYKNTRNELIGKDFSSKFSAWLANGSISARTIYWNIKQFEKDNFKNQSTYWLIFELIWRDFFKYMSLKYNNSFFRIEGILNKSQDWITDQNAIRSWVNGSTRSPFVNANMIELKKTGWMSNRGRQNVASFFAKELKIDWRIGAAYFESLLIDYDVHSNYGNWMYLAGVGNDPRNRMFNMELQSKKYDPQGHYQNLWLQQNR